MFRLAHSRCCTSGCFSLTCSLAVSLLLIGSRLALPCLERFVEQHLPVLEVDVREDTEVRDRKAP